jgi:transposase-like protein
MKTKKEKYGLSKHLARFGTEEKCTDYLVDLKWDGRPKCHHCGNQHLNYFITTRSIWKCSSCKKQFSVKKNTIFEDSKLPLTTWFKAMYFFTNFKRSLSSCQMAKLLEIEQRTAWFLLHRLRAMLDENDSVLLSGIVEVDETYIAPKSERDLRVQRAKQKHEKEQNEKYGYSAKRKTSIRKQLKSEPDGEAKLKEFNEQQKELAKNGERTPFAPAIAVLGMYEREGDVVLIHLGRQYFDTRKKVIEPYVLQHISPDAELVTDQSSFYSEVGKLFLRHHVVNHEVSFVNEEGATTNGIENVWNHLKRMIFGTYFHLTLWHYQRYLNEHAYRWNARNKNLREHFDGFIELVLNKRMKYRDLIIDTKIAA